MDELDYIETLCGIKPNYFLAPDEWKNNDDFLPFESGDTSYKKLEGCYAFCGVDTDLDWELKGIDFLYIGKAVRLRSRMNAHERQGIFDKCWEWCSEHDRLLMIAFWISDDRNALENRLIKRLNPTFNKNRNP